MSMASDGDGDFDDDDDFDIDIIDMYLRPSAMRALDSCHR